jgi:hypothetical protein
MSLPAGVMDDWNCLQFQLIHDTSRQRHFEYCHRLVSWMSWNCLHCWILPDAVIQSSVPDDGQKHRPKHVELTRNNKLTYIFASRWLFTINKIRFVGCMLRRYCCITICWRIFSLCYQCPLTRNTATGVRGQYTVASCAVSVARSVRHL